MMYKSLFYIYHTSLIYILFILQILMEINQNIHLAQQIKFDQSQQQLIDLYVSKNIPKVVLTLAAPGTGKTTTISKIIQAITEQQKFKNIIVLTFTRKTRFDLIRKIDVISEHPEKMKSRRKSIRNIHSFAYEMVGYEHVLQDGHPKKFLKNEVKVLQGVQNIEDLQRQFIKIIGKWMALGYSLQQWQQKCQQFLQIPRLQILGFLLKRYRLTLEQQFNKNKATSYNFSLIKALQLINQGQRIQTCNIDQLQLIIVDEFQDSNPIQLKIVEALMRRTKKDIKLLLVGDFDQNIYTWNYADISYIDSFVNDFKEKGQLDVRMLTNSYRLSESVVKLSQRLIVSYKPYKLFRGRYYRNYVLEAKNPVNKPTQVRTFQSQFSEVRWVVDKIYEHLDQGIPLGQMCILLRSFQGYFFHKLIIQLERRTLLGQQKIFYDSKYNKDLFKSKTIRYLMTIFFFFLKKAESDPNRAQQMKELCSHITCIDTNDEVYQEMIKSRLFNERFVKYSQEVHNQKKKQQNWKKFIEDFKKIELLVNKRKDITFRKVIQQIVAIHKQATWGSVQLDEEKIAQLYVSVQQIEEYLQEDMLKNHPIYPVFNELKVLSGGKGGDDGLHEFKMEKTQKKRNRLQIQTIHVSKGLQYKVVFICSLNYHYPYVDFKNVYSSSEYIDTRLPLFKRNEVQSQKQELRVIYTALTRTKQHSYVSSSQRDIFIPKMVAKTAFKEHKQMNFLKGNAQFYNYEQFQYQRDQEVKDHYDIQMMNKNTRDLKIQ